MTTFPGPAGAKTPASTEQVRPGGDSSVGRISDTYAVLRAWLECAAAAHALPPRRGVIARSVDFALVESLEVAAAGGSIARYALASDKTVGLGRSVGGEWRRSLAIDLHNSRDALDAIAKTRTTDVDILEHAFTLIGDIDAILMRIGHCDRPSRWDDF